MAEINAYDEALKSGQYEKPGGLLGKYDNVRRFWEDEQIGLYLRPYLEKLVTRKKETSERLRILDLGCGSGDGFELLVNIHSSTSPISTHNTAVMQADLLEHYAGLDINEGLLQQARSIYGERQEMSFHCIDINNFENIDDTAYDLYLANYGTFSHNSDDQTVALLGKIARNSKNGAIILVDWLGRYSYEWESLWTNDTKTPQWMDYVISYIYSDDDEKPPELSSFPLRLMGRDDILRITRRARAESSGALVLQQLSDRSSYVGRHNDTAQYNPHCQQIRGPINSLFEPNATTNLDELIIRYVPREGFDNPNSYYQELTLWWNYLINYTKAVANGQSPPEAPAKMPKAAKTTLSTMKQVLKTASKLKTNNPRANLIEPQLGYCLRDLEMGIQKGLGCGHGFVAVFEIVK